MAKYTSNLKASCLGFEINIEYREFETKLHDKRYTYHSSIVRMPYQDSNKTTRIFCAAVRCEILHLATISSKQKFQKLITTLLRRMKRRGCQNTQLKRFLNKLFGKYFETFKRLLDTAKSFIELR